MRHAVLASSIAGFVLLLAPVGSVADEAMGHAVRAADLKWGPAPPVLPKGSQAAVLAGDPSKEGPFVIRVKAPAGYKIPAHRHPTDELVTVISGAAAFGMGDKLDAAKAETLKPGDFVSLPKEMNHFASFPEETVVQISSTGPFKMIYVNPADNPALTQ